jgi:hypothetical protein
MDLRYESVVVETDRYRIDGKLALPREGYRSRLSDYVNKSDRDFFPIVDATVTPLDGGAGAQQIAFALVARPQVRLIIPSEQQDLGPDLA